MGRDPLKKLIQAELSKDFQSMTLRVPKTLHKELAKHRKSKKKSFNKMMIEALTAYLQLKCLI
jgi:predicted HicB family RNase H-like nuclease